jgi:hypothetical protein
MLCRVEKCLGVISVGPGFCLSWVYFSIASMSTVTAVSVCRSLYHCIHSVFHCGRLLGFSRVVHIPSDVHQSQGDHCVSPTCCCRSFLSSN